MTTGQTERQPGHEWVEQERVDNYIARMDTREDEERRPVFEFMTRLIGAEPWNRASVGVAAVSSSPGQVERMLRAVEKDIDDWDGVELLGTTKSYLETAEQ